MSRSSKSEIFVREFVMGMGFLGGLFARTGINPEGEIIKVLVLAFRINPLPFVLISALLTLVSLFIAYFLAKELGILAIGVGFISGYLISSVPEIGAILLIVAVVLGWFAVSEE